VLVAELSLADTLTPTYQGLSYLRDSETALELRDLRD
jgi:hypothetical protein